MKTNLKSLVAGASALVVCAVLACGCQTNKTACCTATVTPAPATVTPAPATVTPAPATVTPAPATVTPAPATATPAPAAPPAAPVKVALKLVKVDSEETAGEDGKGANAVDGDPNTFWHTQWQDASPECPHEIIIELTPPSPIKGFTYLPRQDDIENGTIKDYEFYVSDDGKDFGQPLKKGTFESGKDKKTVTFDLVKCRFIKLKAISEINDAAWASAAEIGVVSND